MIESEHSRKWQPSSMSGLPKKVIPREIVRIRLQRYFLLQARPASAGTGKTPEWSILKTCAVSRAEIMRS